MKANKGEWSEVYVFLKLLSEGKIYGADENLNKISDLFYTLIKIIRYNEQLEFFYDTKIKIYNTDHKLLLALPIIDFKNKAIKLLDEIKNASGSSFEIPEIESFMNKIYCTKIKAPSREKRDITIVVKDLELGAEPELGFSIKSQIGNPSTLLNAGQTTNFIYEVKNIRKNQIEKINALEGRSKIKDRLQKIKDLKGIVEYSSMQSQTFKNNMEIIDSSLPGLIAEYVFSFFTDSSNKILDLTNDIISKDPLNIGDENKNAFYKNKIKHFLRSVSLGMTPTNSWDTNNEVTGGFIVVKKDGEILCYHIYNKEDFENYLYKNTKFDTASSGRHKFGLLYADNNKIFFKLNLQIRFIT